MALYKDQYRTGTMRAEWIDYNYGVFFITICTKDKQSRFGYINDGKMFYSAIGEITLQCVNGIVASHPDCKLWNHVVMPNHVHLLLQVVHKGAVPKACTGNARAMSQIANRCGHVSHIVSQFKSAVTRMAHAAGLEFAWQSRFYDHAVRDHDDMSRIYQYIDNNISAWSEDRFHQQ